jgi:hypothetical protein
MGNEENSAYERQLTRQVSYMERLFKRVKAIQFRSRLTDGPDPTCVYDLFDKNGEVIYTAHWTPAVANSRALEYEWERMKNPTWSKNRECLD